MPLVVVIDASALESILTNMPSFWEGIKRGGTKVVIGKPRLVKQYSKRINDMRRNGVLERGSHVLRHLMSLALWVGDKNYDKSRHGFRCREKIPRKDIHLFVAAKEAALRENIKECLILSLDSSVIRVEQCENGRNVRIIVKEQL
ncbi:MAG: hypothetical protein EFT35_00760 [Methanophagales archaeon ANME-1-THS]|nr:MAG: hypothetical protein EFT35_00760 [Methanophagales archaeon ANME-1-THS]